MTFIQLNIRKRLQAENKGGHLRIATHHRHHVGACKGGWIGGLQGQGDGHQTGRAGKIRGPAGKGNTEGASTPLSCPLWLSNSCMGSC